MNNLRIMKTRLLLLFTFGALALGLSQTSENPWRLTISANAIDVYPVGGTPSRLFPDGAQGDFFEDFANIGDHWTIGGPTISLERFLKGKFSVGAMLSVNNLTKVDGIASGTEYPYISADGFLKYSPFGGGKISPFFLGGWGLSSFQFANPDDTNAILLSKNASKQVLGGFGLDFRLSPSVALSLQSNFKNAYELDGVRHFQHQAGLSYNFGTGDRDKDGISDEKDKCPDVPGLKEFEGCPDTDEDGIPDNEDDCPEEAGSKELKGCPDSDGDGVADKDDLCPDVAGSVEMQGCPDKDSDGIHDGIDECPDKAGPESNNGCPIDDKDGDGVPDADDLCPDLAGSAEKNGCPDTSDSIVSTMNTYGSMINFVANSDRILGKKMFDVLEKIKGVLAENSGGIFVIEGYSSNDGDEAYNQALSIKRAESVRNALINMGVDAARLEIQGFGEANPLDSNDTSEGRAKNRRVQFRLKSN